jgi:hypothetical protein
MVGALFRRLPVRVADALAAPLLKVFVGDVTALGLRKPPFGAMEQIKLHGRIPLIDVGTLALLRDGHIALKPGVERFTESSAVFEGGAEQPFDAVVLATGYRPGLEDFLPSAREVCDARGFPRSSGQVLPGLHLCGFELSTRGMLKEIGREAQHAARDIASA